MHNAKNNPPVESQWLNDIQLSKYLNVSLGSVRKWRANGTGPLYRKLGDLVRYSLTDVERWTRTLPAGGGRIDAA